jgi:hypothetical protein
MVAFLGYALWVTLKHWLKRKQSALSPAKALALLSTLHSADIVLPTVEGREFRLRRITEPSDEQKRLLQQLGLALPDHSQIRSTVRSFSLATALTGPLGWSSGSKCQPLFLRGVGGWMLATPTSA